LQHGAEVHASRVHFGPMRTRAHDGE